MNCSKCGAPNAADASFCGICGNNLKENINNVEQPAPAVSEPALEMPAPAAQPVAPAAPAPAEMPAPAAPAEPVVPAVEPAPVAEVVPTPVVPAPVVETPVAPADMPAAAPVQPVPEPVAPVAETPVTPVEPAVVEPQPVAPVEVAPVEVAPTPVAPVEQPVVAAAPVMAPVQPMQPGIDPMQAAAQPAVVAPTVAPASKNILSNKKILIPIIAVAAVVLLVVGFLVIKNLGGGAGSEKSAVKTLLDPKKPVLVEKSGKYGYVSYKGKVLIEPKYSEATEFYGKYAIVKVDDAEYDYTYQIINQKGKEQLKEAVIGQPTYDSEYGTWIIDYRLYNSNLKPITKEGISVFEMSAGYYTYSNYDQERSGIMNAKGKSLWDWKHSSFYGDLSESMYDEKDLYVAVKSYDDETEVIVSLKKGKIVCELENYKRDNIHAESNGIFTIKDEDSYDTKTWLYFKDGKLKYETSDSKIEDIEVYDDEKQILELYYGYNDDYEREYKYYDVKAKEFVTDVEDKDDYDEDEDLDLIELTYGFKPFESSDKYGIMSEDKILVPSKYDDVEFISYAPFLYMKEFKNKELVLFEKDDKMILYDVKKNKEINTFDASSATTYEASSFIKLSKYEDYDLEGYIVYNLITGEMKEYDEDAELEFGSNFYKEKNGSKDIYYNTDMEQIYEG